jgi:hypothetical protein
MSQPSRPSAGAATPRSTLKTELGTRNSDLAAERERADKAINGFEALLRTESARADRAIAAFESLAQRLEAMEKRGGPGGDA